MIRTLLCMVALTAVASADPTVRSQADAKTAYAEGQRRYLAEDYAGAAEQFRIAYQADPDPAYLFNIAQAFRFANQCGRAARYYRRFLDTANNPANKADVEHYLAEQEACAQSQPDPGPDPILDPKPDPVVTPTPAPTPTPTPPPDPRLDSDDTTPRGQTRRRLGIGALALGAVGVGAGIAFGLHVESLEREREGLCKPMCPTDVRDREADLQHSANRSTALEIAGYAVGAAAIGTGVYLYLSGRKTERRVAVVPVRGGAGVVLTWTGR